MKYGLPYKGSKNKLAERIIDILPDADHMIDMFCGGCAIAHAALVKGKYQHVHINDLNWMCPTLFKDALEGKYADDTRWISREDFERLKTTDPYVAMVWSFGNNLRDYMYSKDIEPLKRAIHYAMYFNDYEPGKELGHDFSFVKDIPDVQEKYTAIKQYFIGGGNSSTSNPSAKETESRQYKVKRPYELQHMECTSRVSQFKKKNRDGELCNCERRNNVLQIAESRIKARLSTDKSFGGGKFHLPTQCLTMQTLRYRRTA